MMLQEGGSPQTEQQMSEMIKENLTLSVKKGKHHALHLIGFEVRCHVLVGLSTWINLFFSEISSSSS